MQGHKTHLERLALNQDWVPVAGALTSLAKFWANRTDLMVYLGRDGGESAGSAAFFDPERGQIEINSEKAFGAGSDGSRIRDLLDRMELSKYPVAGGLTLHESMHARFSRSDLRKMRDRFDKGSAFGCYQHLEETRIEGRAVLVWKSDSVYLRASCRDLLMAEGPASWSPRAAAVLLVGREPVGVLTPDDVAPVEQWLIDNGWNPGVIVRLREIVKEFLFLDDDVPIDVSRMVELAIELDELMPPEPEGSQDGGQSEGLGEAIAAALDKAAVGGRTAVVEEAQKAANRARREAESEAQEQRETHSKKADEIFRRDGNPAPVPSELRGSRPPSGAERSAAVVLSKELERARYRDRATVPYDSASPTGSFNGGEAMRRDAALWAGAPVEPHKPFRKRARMETEQPPLTVGVMCDTSGSMSSAQPAVGVANWVISDAVYRIGKANAAMVYFGTTVAPGLRRGERQKAVRTWSGGGGYEDFDRGFKALDGELNLLGGRGARLLFIVSDGQYKRSPLDQFAASEKWINTCIRNGVAVVWIQLAGNIYRDERPGMEIVPCDDGDILSAVKVIGSACKRALARVSGL